MVPYGYDNPGIARRPVLTFELKQLSSRRPSNAHNIQMYARIIYVYTHNSHWYVPRTAENQYENETKTMIGNIGMAAVAYNVNYTIIIILYTILRL